MGAGYQSRFTAEKAFAAVIRVAYIQGFSIA
jgi:hypothetical protein